MRRFLGTVVLFPCAVWLLLPRPAAGVSSSSKTFFIVGATPMQAIAVEALRPKNAQQQQFIGAAELQLSGASTLRLAARLQHKRKKDKGVYRFTSTAAGFPRFRGTILTSGEPEVVTRVRLVLTRSRGDKVKEKSSGNVSVAPESTPTTVLPGATTTTTSVPTTTLISGCFQDRGDGTIVDTCTGLQWEKKTTTVGGGPDASNTHDVDNRYTWAGSCSPSGNLCQPNAAAAATCAANTGGALGCGECVGAPCDVDPNGVGAITTLWNWLAQVNSAGFAGHGDWRLPSAGGGAFQASSDEFATILLAPCSAPPCIDPIFGPTDSGGYWSATTSSIDPRDALIVFFGDGSVNDFSKTLVSHVRAVRSSP